MWAKFSIVAATLGWMTPRHKHGSECCKLTHVALLRHGRRLDLTSTRKTATNVFVFFLWSEHMCWGSMDGEKKHPSCFAPTMRSIATGLGPPTDVPWQSHRSDENVFDLLLFGSASAVGEGAQSTRASWRWPKKKDKATRHKKPPLNSSNMLCSSLSIRR